MPHYSATSLDRLNTCDERLVDLFIEVIKHRDCRIICGHRGEEEQNDAYHQGHSQVKFPNSNHNVYPSRAVDVAPYPIDWQDIDRFKFLGGFVLGVAAAMKIPLKWGGEWSSFKDYPHFELTE